MRSLYNSRMKSSLADLIGSGTGCHAVQVEGHGCRGFQRVSVEPVSHGEKIQYLNGKKDALLFQFTLIFNFKDILFFKH